MDDDATHSRTTHAAAATTTITTTRVTVALAQQHTFHLMQEFDAKCGLVTLKRFKSYFHQYVIIDVWCCVDGWVDEWMDSADIVSGMAWT